MSLVRILGSLLAALVLTVMAMFETASRESALEGTLDSVSAAAVVATPNAKLAGIPEIQLVKVAGGLADPVEVAAPNDGSGRLFVVERFGHIRIIGQDGSLRDEPFLDLTSQVQSGYHEQGMLGLAFHPEYRTNGRFFVAFTEFVSNGDTVVMEFRVAPDDPDVADSKSGKRILAVDQPYVTHNGGTIQFGPDGYLYIGIGDGGLEVDPSDTALNLSSLLGKLLRIDVDQEVSGGAGHGTYYGIPADNPFVKFEQNDELVTSVTSPTLEVPDQPNRKSSAVQIMEPLTPQSDDEQQVRPEIWAFGLRNPWQFSFDARTGDLFIPDVGWNKMEELNFESAGGVGGQNYGWDRFEGTRCNAEDVSNCPSPEGVVFPVAEYEHGDDGCAIVGIGVYHGTVSPSLDGVYFYSDLCSGKVWGLNRGVGNTWVSRELLNVDNGDVLLPTGGGEDAAGELYLTTLTQSSDFGSSGNIWRIVDAGRVSEKAETAPIEPVQEGEPVAEPDPLPTPRFSIEGSPVPPGTSELSSYEVAWDEANFASTMPASTQQCGAVKFRNTSEQMWLRSGIFISYHWYRDEPGGQRRQADAWDGVRTALPHDIGPGQTLIADDVCVLTPSVPASYVLQLTLVQENVAWFETKGAETVEVLVTVQ